MRKSSFLTFCFAFVPGAGQMYLGMMRKGLAVMLTFWGICAVSWLLHIEFLMWFLPVIFCYSFFDTFNIKWYPPEQRDQLDREFGQRVERYWLGENGFTWQFGRMRTILEKRHLIVGLGLMLFGAYLILQNFFLPVMDAFFDAFAWEGYHIVSRLVNRLPSVLVSLAIIFFGVHLVRGGKKPPEANPDYVEYKGENDE